MEVGGLVEAQFKFWWHLRSSFGGIVRSSFGGIYASFGGFLRTSLVVIVCVFGGGISPTTDTRTTPRSTSGGHVMQAWWSFG